MEELDLSRNEINEEEMVHLSKCIHKVKRFHFCLSSITSNGMKYLSDAIMKLEKPVRILLNVLES